MEASSIPTTAGLGRDARTSVGPLLRLRSDEQLVKLFRQGSEEAFRAIYDRYRARIFAYTRQMLAGSRQDAEDALQDVFVRAYGALRSSERDISLRAWLYRVAHNRCIDELRRPAPPSPELLEQFKPPSHDPIAEIEQRESLRRLVEDVRRLPDQQRSALLMREIDGMSYQELASALDVTVPAVKSLLVRARMGLAAAAEAREAACEEIRVELADAHDRGVRASGRARRHLRDCAGCRAYRRELKSLRERFAALTPAVGPFAVLLKLLGIGGGTAAGGGAVAGGAAVGYSAAVGGSVSAGHVAAVVAAAVVGAGGVVEVKRTLSPPPDAGRAAAVVRVVSTGAAAALPTAVAQAAPTVVEPARADPRERAAPPTPVVHARARPAAGGIVAAPAVTAPAAPAPASGEPPADANGTGGAAPPTDDSLAATPPGTTAPLGEPAPSSDATASAGAPSAAPGSSAGTTESPPTGGSASAGATPKPPAGTATGTAYAGPATSGGQSAAPGNTTPTTG